MSDLSSLSRPPKLHALTSLRFFAALCIFVLHAGNHGLLSMDYLQIFDLSKAVSFFFVLSGFVIGYAYNGRVIKAWHFFQARFARIWPVTILSIFFVLLILPRLIYLPSSSSSWPVGIVLLLNFLCLQAFFPVPDVFFSFNAVAWSISVEVFFYFCFTLIHRLRISSLLFITIFHSLLVLMLAYLLSFSSLVGFSSESLNVPVLEGFVYINPIARLPEFLMGVLLARLFVSREFVGAKLIYQKARLKCWFMIDVLEIFIVFFAFWYGFHTYSFPLPPTAQIAFLQIVSGTAFCLLILTVANSSGLVCQLLKWKPLLLLGEVSFGFYLFHQPIMIRSAQLNGFNLGGIQFLSAHFIPVLAWSITISIASFFLFERPMQKLLKPKGSA